MKIEFADRDPMTLLRISWLKPLVRREIEAYLSGPHGLSSRGVIEEVFAGNGLSACPNNAKESGSKRLDDGQLFHAKPMAYILVSDVVFLNQEDPAVRGA